MSKKIIAIFLALSVVFSCCSMAVTAKDNAGEKVSVTVNEDTKEKVSVTAESVVREKVSVTLNSNDTDFMKGIVLSDYSAKLTVPHGSVINAKELTGTISMTDIASLGITGTRTYSKSITTGVDNEVVFDNYIPAFESATVSGAIDGVEYKYNIEAFDADDCYTIEAIPEDEAVVRAAYQALASHVTAGTKAADDSYAEIPGTAYVQIGTEKLSFENTEETMKLDNIMQGTGLKAEIRSAVKLEEVEELEDAQIEAYIPAGTVLAVGQSVVTLNDNATIKMYGYDDNDDVNTIFSKLRECETNEQIILTAVMFITDFANAINGADLVVNVDFEEEIIEEEIIESAAKVSATLTSNGVDFMKGVVMSDYSAKLTVPHGSVINAKELTGTISMTDIASLGITGTRTYSKSITTGVDNEVVFDNYIPAFESATVSGAIDGVEYKYNIEAFDADDCYTIEAIPEDEAAVRAAYQALASHVTAGTKSADDSYAEIPGTAYVQIGTEKLSFENTEETMKLDNIMQGTGLKAEIRSAVKLEEVEELEDAQIEAYIPAGTVLAVGQSVVTLNDNATIKMYGYDDNDDVNTIFSKLRECETNEQIILTAVMFITDFANAINGADLVVNVEFEEEKGTQVSGSIDSAFADKETTIELVSDGEVLQSITASDSYNFDAVKDGTYTIRVSKENHVTREYEIEVNGDVVIEDLKLNLIGDVDGDDRVNVRDYTAALKHVKKTGVLSGYEYDCADVIDDGRVNVSDYTAILKHVKKVQSLW